MFKLSLVRFVVFCAAAIWPALLLVAPAAHAGTCVPPPVDMIGWWPGDDDASDIQGENDGVLVNGALAGVTGRVDGAFRFDGVDDYVEVSSSPSLNPTDAISIDAWVKPTQFNIAGRIVQKGDFDNQYRLYYQGRIFFIINNVGSIINAGPLPLDVWSHVAATYDGTTMSVYVDGRLRTSIPAAGPIPTSDHPLYIGTKRASFFPHDNWVGLIDEVEIFDRALSAPEIRAIFNGGSAGKCKGAPPPPSFTSPECGSTIHVEPGDTVEFTVTAEDAPERTVTLDVSGLPPGAIMHPALPITGNPVSSLFTWTTDDSHNNTGQIVEFTETNDAGVYARCRVPIEVGDYTLVTLVSFTAIPGDGQVTLHWTTGSEIDNAGFYLLRSTVAARGTVRLHKGLIPAMGDVFTGADYTYVDETVVNGVEYEYTLVDVDLYGTETRHPPVRATPNPQNPPVKQLLPVYGATLSR